MFNLGWTEMLVIGIVAILSSIAVSSYAKYMYRAEITQVVVDMGSISRRIDLFRAEAGYLPESLEMAGAVMTDPWGNPYQYLRIDSSGVPGAGGPGGGGPGGGGPGGGGLGQVRKDKNLVPINSDYDLYSMGRDGQSVSPLTAEPSRDDVVRASNGSYIGLAERY